MTVPTHAKAGTRAPRAGAAPSWLARAGAAAWQLTGIALAVLVTGWAIGKLMPVVLPCAVALLGCTLLRPVAAALERRRVPPALAALATIVLAVAVIGALVLVILPPFVERLAELGTSISTGARRVAYSVGHDVAGLSHSQVDRALNQAVQRVQGHLGGLAGDAVSGATAVAAVLGGAVLVVFLSFFLLKDGPRIWAWLLDLAPERRRETLDEAGRRAWRVLGVYTRGVVFVATVDAVFIGLAIVLLGVPLALPLIVLTWLAAFFPIIGAVTAGAAAVLVALVAEGLTSALIMLAAIVAVQQIEGNVLYPLVVGPRLKLHPIVVLLAVAAGGTVGGIPGAFLAVPVATVAAALLGYGRETRAEQRRAAVAANGHG